MAVKLPKKLTKYHLRLLFGVAHIILGMIHIGLHIVVAISSSMFHTQNAAENFLKAGFVLGALDILYGIYALYLFFHETFNYPLRLREAILGTCCLIAIILYIAVLFRWYAHAPDFTDNFKDCHEAARWPEYYMCNRPPHCSAYFIKRVIMWLMIGFTLLDLCLDVAQLVVLRILWIADVV